MAFLFQWRRRVEGRVNRWRKQVEEQPRERRVRPEGHHKSRLLRRRHWKWRRRRGCPWWDCGYSALCYLPAALLLTESGGEARGSQGQRPTVLRRAAPKWGEWAPRKETFTVAPKTKISCVAGEGWPSPGKWNAWELCCEGSALGECEPGLGEVGGQLWGWGGNCWLLVLLTRGIVTTHFIILNVFKNITHLLKVHYVPKTDKYFTFIISLLSTFCSRRNWGFEKLSDLPKVT